MQGLRKDHKKLAARSYDDARTLLAAAACEPTCAGRWRGLLKVSVLDSDWIARDQFGRGIIIQLNKLGNSRKGCGE